MVVMILLRIVWEGSGLMAWGMKRECSVRWLSGVVECGAKWIEVERGRISECCYKWPEWN